MTDKKTEQEQKPKPDDTEQTMFSVKQVAKMLGVDPYTVRTWVWNNELPSYRLGTRTIRVSKTDLDTFIADRKAVQ